MVPLDSSENVCITRVFAVDLKLQIVYQKQGKIKKKLLK